MGVGDGRRWSRVSVAWLERMGVAYGGRERRNHVACGCPWKGCGDGVLCDYRGVGS